MLKTGYAVKNYPAEKAVRHSYFVLKNKMLGIYGYPENSGNGSGIVSNRASRRCRVGHGGIGTGRLRRSI